MKRSFGFLAASLVGVLAVAGGAASAPGQKDDPAVCNGDFGTAVHFLKTPSDAAKQARKEQKLVLVLHVSGDFEDPDFT